jgi:hypothetical protein
MREFLRNLGFKCLVEVISVTLPTRKGIYIILYFNKAVLGRNYTI